MAGMHSAGCTCNDCQRLMYADCFGNSSFKPLRNGWGIQPIGSSPIGGDIHDTFKVDKSGDISGGHTTIRISKGQDIQLKW